MLGILTLFLICVGCGDQYRPVAVPIVPPSPDPDAIHFVLVLSNNGSIDPGASSRMDVSGDTNIGVAQLGLGPAHATLISNGARVYAVNTLEDSVSSFSPNPGSTATVVTTTSLPAGSRPVFVHTRESGTVYVANFGEQHGGRNLGQQQCGAEPADCRGQSSRRAGGNSGPEETLRGESGRRHVTAISLVDRSVVQTITTGTTPVWAVARSDSARIYVLNSGSGTVSAIDTVTDSVVGSASVGAGANYMVV